MVMYAFKNLSLFIAWQINLLKLTIKRLAYIFNGIEYTAVEPTVNNVFLLSLSLSCECTCNCGNNYKFTLCHTTMTAANILQHMSKHFKCFMLLSRL